MNVDLTINSAETIEQIVNFLRETMRNAGFSDVVIGLSGGIDSATTCALAVQALGIEHVYPIIMPFGELNSEAEQDANLLIQHLCIPDTHVYRINIQPFIDSLLSIDSQIDVVRKGNIMARMRMIILYDFSKRLNALVLGTENKSEHLLGYFTRFGDEASDIEPIRSLYKTQVRQLANAMKIPKKIVNKSPTAALWEGQTDENEFGFTYEEADQIMSLFEEFSFSEKEVCAKGFSPEVINRVKERMASNSFKHRLPYFLKM